MEYRLAALHTRAALGRICGPDDMFARLDPPADLHGWRLGGAVAFVRLSSVRPPSLFAWGPQVGALLEATAALGVAQEHRIGSVSVPVEHQHEVTSRFAVTSVGIWDWMWCDSMPAAAPHEEDLIALDDEHDAAEIAAFGLGENPLFEGFAGTGYSQEWVGLRSAGRLIACGAVQRLPSGVAHLGGIVVAHDARRQGLGRAISTALTRKVLTREQVCTLGMYSKNDIARRLYRDLSYTSDKTWASHGIADPS
ncbi:GNAT family N-acetyltransferase [Gephyromycinifex aptenodytis]|uniref:GNAT family N-acetyltransferase n=1 Tax=Gephyromycinifex aptenodytis TaxID=2716227 RepID=UPI001444AEB2|nr:GNAT family N-acetyltransferase [Gephyromycinifex aptenodytis]